MSKQNIGPKIPPPPVAYEKYVILELIYWLTVQIQIDKWTCLDLPCTLIGAMLPAPSVFKILISWFIEIIPVRNSHVSSHA